MYQLAQSPNASPELRKSLIELMSAYSRKTSGSNDYISKEINAYCIQAGGYQIADPLADNIHEKTVVRIDLSSETAKQVCFPPRQLWRPPSTLCDQCASPFQLAKDGVRVIPKK